MNPNAIEKEKRRNANSLNVSLSKAEIKVSAYVCAGYENKEIAEQIYRSPHTISTHIKNIRFKKDLKNRSEIARVFALEYGDPFEFIKIQYLS